MRETEQDTQEYRGANGLSKDLKEVMEPRGCQAKGTASVRPWGGTVPGVCRKPRTPAEGAREGGGWEGAGGGRGCLRRRGREADQEPPQGLGFDSVKRAIARILTEI